MLQSNPIWQISEAEEAALALERQKLEAQLKREPPLRKDGLPRIRRQKGVQPTKEFIVINTAVQGKCWLWSLSKSDNGYGYSFLNGRRIGAHQLSLIVWGNPRPKIGPRNALHKCDQRSCLNPAHLYWGSQSNNNLDSVRRGRFRRPTGERWHSRKPHRTYKICGKVLERAISLRSDGRSYAEISKLIGVKKSSVAARLKPSRIFSHSPHQ